MGKQSEEEERGLRGLNFKFFFNLNFDRGRNQKKKNREDCLVLTLKFFFNLSFDGGSNQKKKNREDCLVLTLSFFQLEF